MKILKIRFKNINSLRGEHEIDFTKPPLAEGGLFAITGPTGSGKSTLLDVITLALFNQVPRLGKVSKNFVAQSGALLTRNTQDAYAIVEYHCQKGTFRSGWSISVNRKGNLRDYEMELSNLESGQSLDLKKGEVPARNEKQIGLNYEQFVKSILLAQGEFAQFLKVSKSERGELLEKITGTGIYRELGRKAFEMKGRFAKGLDELRQRKNTYAEQLLADEAIQEAQILKKTKAGEVEILEKKLAALEKQLALKQEMQSLTKKIEESTKKEDMARQRLLEFEREYGHRLQQHEKTADFAEKLEQWRSEEKNLVRIKEENKILQEQLEQSIQAKSTFKEKIKTLIQKESPDDALLDNLEDFRKRVLLLQKDIEQKKQDYKSLSQQLNVYGKQLGFQPDIKQPAAALEQLQRLQAHSSQKLSELREQLNDLDLSSLNAEKSKLAKHLEMAGKGQQISASIKKDEKQMALQQEKASLLKHKQEQIPERIRQIKTRLEPAELRVEKLSLQIENEKLRASLEDKRSQLKNGDPCPLCGSLDHPFARHTPPADDHLSESLLHAQKELKELHRQATIIETESVQLASQEKEITHDLKVLENAISENHKLLKEECAELLKTESLDWEKLVLNLRDQEKALLDYEQHQTRQEIYRQCTPLLTEMIKLVKTGSELRDRKKNLYEADDIDDAIARERDTWHQVIHSITNIQKSLKNLETQQLTSLKFQTDLSEDFLPTLRKEGFRDIADALNQRLTEKEYLDWSKQQKQLHQSVQAFHSELKSLNQSFDEKKNQDTENTVEELTDLKSQHAITLKENRAILQEAERKLKNQEDTLKRIAEVEEKIKQEEKTGRKWELLCNLIGDATGKKFNDFAQDLTLQQLLLLANKRLEDLSDRYRIDRPEESEDDSLVAIDEHMGGQRRSVKTLSGGETFVLSLSLALALSDLASKNVEINSLFIDEGFGTLDPETLDQTLDTLERLQAESAKTIGIISHVEALKERIGTQVQLMRNGQGYSSLKIV